MVEELVIDQDERKRLTSGRSVDRPKYTFFALDNAVKYSSATQKTVLGDVNEIYEEFRERFPDGDYEDWERYYLGRYNGDDRIEKSTERAYDMLITIREAIKQLDKSDVRKFVKGVAIQGTYENRNGKEAVIKKLISRYPNCESVNPDDESSEADLFFGTESLSVVPYSDEKTSELQSENTITYTEKDGKIKIDLSGLNMSLDDF